MTEPLAGERFQGKFRGVVRDNADPAGRGRLKIDVAGVPQKDEIWAEPCVPLAGPLGAPMGAYLVPPVDTGVWVEFERGDPDYPVWVGCIWGGKDGSSVPAQARQGSSASPSIILQTMGQNSLVISDAPNGGITLQTASGAMISINETGITIRSADGASIELGDGAVKVNQDALEVT
jgi:uncharacterized protein involved in type VI secretion and phage assembly